MWLFRQYKLLVSQVYDRADSQTAKDFLLKHVLKEFHFKNNQIQVDSGIKFLDNFEQTCKDNNIALFVLPQRNPKLNGGVKRINRFVQEEYYLQYYNFLKPDIVSLRKFVKFSQIQYNYFRIHIYLNINNRLFLPMEFLYLSKTAKCI